jgi:hypothetical protein
MQLRIVRRFSDRLTGEAYSVGQVIDVDDARAEELLDHPLGVVELVANAEPNAEDVTVEQTEPPKTKKTRKKKA